MLYTFGDRLKVIFYNVLEHNEEQNQSWRNYCEALGVVHKHFNLIQQLSQMWTLTWLIYQLNWLMPRNATVGPM